MGLIRVATVADSKAILSIYSPFCQALTAVALEQKAPTLEEMEKRVAETLKAYPWLVYEHDGVVLGYTYAEQHKNKAAFNWDVDVHVFLHEKIRGQGIGKKLYKHLFDGLRTLGYYNAYASIGLPNEAAIALHKTLGFNLVGVFNSVAFKGGAWRDVACFALKLQAHELNPQPPIKFSQLGL